MAFSSGRAVPTISVEKEGGDIKVMREWINNQSTSHTLQRPILGDFLCKESIVNVNACETIINQPKIELIFKMFEQVLTLLKEIL